MTSTPLSPSSADETARLVFITHASPERNLRATLAAFDELDVVKDVHSVVRVIGS